MSDLGIQRISTETSEEAVIQHYLQPAIDEQVRQEFPELKNAALTINFTFVWGAVKKGALSPLFFFNSNLKQN